MKKGLMIFAIIIIIAGVCIIGGIIAKNSKITNDSAQKDKNGRYLTIINHTEQIINEVHVTVGSGTEIEEMKQINPDETSFSIKIPSQYSDYDKFNVTIIDRYGLKYQKEIENVSKKGRTEVIIGKENYVEGKGDVFNKLDKWFNGD